MSLYSIISWNHKNSGTSSVKKFLFHHVQAADPVSGLIPVKSVFVNVNGGIVKPRRLFMMDEAWFHISCYMNSQK